MISIQQLITKYNNLLFSFPDLMLSENNMNIAYSSMIGYNSNLQMSFDQINRTFISINLYLQINEITINKLGGSLVFLINRNFYVPDYMNSCSIENQINIYNKLIYGMRICNVDVDEIENLPTFIKEAVKNNLSITTDNYKTLIAFS